MEAKIYLAQGTEKLGPFSHEEVGRRLLDGEISGSTLAWRAGMADWLPVTTVLDGMAQIEGGSSDSRVEPERMPGIGRLAYFVLGVAESAILILAGGVMVRAGVDPKWSPMIPIAMLCLWAVLAWFRLKNIGYQPWWALLCVVPFFGAVIGIPCLMAPPGYARTKRLDLPAKIMGGIFIGVIVAGFLAGLLRPLLGG